MELGRPREEGVALWAFLCFLSVMVAGSAALGMLSIVESRASSESERFMHAYYLADSGAQIANAMLRASGGSPSLTSMSESLAGGSVTVSIAEVAGIYEVTSTGTYEGESNTVIMYVEFISNFSMDGSMQVNFGEGVEVEAGAIPFELNGASRISGMDHDASGNLLVDQDNATYGLAMTPIPGDVGVDIFVDVAGGADLEGDPTETTNTVEGDDEVFNQLIAYARNNADVVVTGPATLENVDTGSYGTSAAPKLVYVELGDEEQLTMGQNFSGHGTLVISVGDTTMAPALYMRDTSQWYGLVIVEFRGEAEVPNGSLIELFNDALIVGGLAATFTGDDTTFEGTGNVLELGGGNAAIKFSSELVGSTSGLDQVVDYSAEVIAYRKQ